MNTNPAHMIYRRFDSAYKNGVNNKPKQDTQSLFKKPDSQAQPDMTQPINRVQRMFDNIRKARNEFNDGNGRF